MVFFFFKITRSSQWLRTERSVWVVKGRRCANRAQSTRVYSSQHCISASSRLNTLPCPREQTWQPNWASHRHRYEHDTNIHNKKTDRHSLDLIYQLCNFLWCSNFKGEKRKTWSWGSTKGESFSLDICIWNFSISTCPAVRNLLFSFCCVIVVLDFLCTFMFLSWKDSWTLLSSNCGSLYKWIKHIRHYKCEEQRADVCDQTWCLTTEKQ